MSVSAIKVSAVVIACLVLAYLVFSKSTEATQIRASLRETLFPLWKAFCWIYIIPWRIWFRLRYAVVQTLLFVVTVVSLAVVGESISILLLHHKDIAAHFPWIPVHSLDRFELPLWADVLAIVLSVLLSWHHVREWKAGQRSEKLPEALEAILRRFGQSANKSLPPSQADKEALFNDLILEFRKVLELRRKLKISASLMKVGTDGKLGFDCAHEAHPDDKFNKQLKLNIAQGAAGVSYAGPISVYVPSVSHLVLINAQTIEPVGLFERQAPPEPFRSLLCIPVTGTSKALAVLTFASRSGNAFSPADYQIMRLAAVFVASFY